MSMNDAMIEWIDTVHVEWHLIYFLSFKHKLLGHVCYKKSVFLIITFYILSRRKRFIYLVLNLEPPNFYDAYVQRGDPHLWTFGYHVGISWDSQELAADQLVTVEIINLLDGRGGIKVHSSVTLISDQLNTGKAEFHLPKMETLGWVYNEIVN